MKRLFLLLILVSFSTSASAQWETATPPAVFRSNLTSVLIAQQNFARTVAEVNAEFRDAHAALANARPRSKAYKAAAERLEKLQLGKDVYYLSSYLQSGVNQHSRTASQLAAMLGGGAIDGGIPPAAIPEFEAWVSAVRASLGAENKDILILGDEDIPRLHDAITSNESVYAQYISRLKSLPDEEKKIRQDAIEQAKQYEAVKLPDGGVRLHESNIAPLEPTDFFNIGGPLWQKLFELGKSDQKMIHCTYGPVPGVRDEPTFKNYSFWYQQIPVIDPKLAGDTNGHVRLSLHRPAQTACPRSSFEAGKIWEMGKSGASIETSPPPAPQTVAQAPAIAKPTNKTQPENASWCERTGAHINKSRARSAATGRPAPKGIKDLEDKYSDLCL